MTRPDPPAAPDGGFAAGSLRAMRSAYGDSAATWAGGPARIYRVLAAALVRSSEVDVRGRRVLDLGSGTGVLADALAAAGARPVALDLAYGMLAHRAAQRPPAVAADARALPFRDAGLDGVGAAFSLTHVPDPGVALAEVRRVLVPGGFVLACSYHADNDHPAKRATDEAARAFGYEPPGWYAELKHCVEPAFATRDAVRERFEAAGFGEVRVSRQRVDVGVGDARSMVAWRLGMASLAPFVSSLDPTSRAALVDRACAALGDTPIPYRPDVVFVRGRRPV